jgi:hypothetical protein
MATGSDVADVFKEKLAQFLGQVSNPNNVWEFMKRWAGEDANVEEGLGEEGEGEDNNSDNLEVVISDDNDEEDKNEDD